MKKKKRITLSIILSILILMVFVFVIPMINILPSKVEYKMFDNVEEFMFVEEIAEDILSPSTDKNIKGISFTESKEFRIKYDGAIYNIYVYVFENINATNEYYKKVTGKHNDRAETFSSSGNYYFSTSLVVLSNNRVYRITGPGNKKFTKFIGTMNTYLLGSAVKV